MADTKTTAPPAADQPGLYAKLIAAQSAISSVEKNGKNEQQHYEYARAEDVIAGASKALTEAGLAVLPTMGDVQTVREYETRSGSYGVTVRVEMLYTVVDPETGESIERRYLGTGSDSPGDKAIYKATTGAAKYFYAGLLGIGFGADPEDESGGTDAQPIAPAAGMPDTVVRLNPERTDRIIGNLAALKLSYGAIGEKLRAAGVEGLRANTADAIRERIASLGEVQADKLEAELEKESQDADALATDALPSEHVEQLLKRWEIVKPILKADERNVNALDGLNFMLGSLGIDGFEPADHTRPDRGGVRNGFAGLTPEQADLVEAEFNKMVDAATGEPAEEVDAEIVAQVDQEGGEANADS